MACPRKRGDLLADHRTSSGWWSLMCPVCCVSVAVISKDYDEALDQFWQKHDSRNKEISMSTADYKRGVEDALAPLTPTEKYNWAQKDGYIDRDDSLYLFADRKKKLLTRKEIKWFFLIQYCTEPEKVRTRTPNYSGDSTSQVALYDTKELAEEDMKHFSRTFGPYSLEIEVNL